MSLTMERTFVMKKAEKAGEFDRTPVDAYLAKLVGIESSQVMETTEGASAQDLDLTGSSSVGNTTTQQDLSGSPDVTTAPTSGETSPEAAFVAEVWKALAGHKDLFQSPRSDSRDARKIAKALSNFANPVTAEVPDGGHYVRFYSSSGEITIRRANTKRPYISSANAASQGKKAGGGSLLYVAALDWIHNNKKTIEDDPGGLTEINYTRRTSNFLASALRWGTTEHLSPHDDQMIEGWSDDHRNNIALLAIAEMRNVHEKIKKSIGWKFDFQKNAFYDGTTELTEEDLEKAVNDGKPGTSGVGLSTLRRAIVTATALRAAGSTSASDLLDSKTSPFPSSLQDISYSLGWAE